ncbi:Oligopeptide transport system permease protein oppB [Salmonella enterica subsp. enterica]|uniref:Oligopeptide transport system permease protein oppB n=1 Tax=Salmonella enterica I TaxID=59201 RepID=A0A3S4ITI7_SALET|nr:Oligopeptide transport system permease protein oppB [Salmonella enterica subsp. enterica]
MLAVIIGVSAGVIAALKQNTRWDYTVMGFCHDRRRYPQFCGGAATGDGLCDNLAMAAWRRLETAGAFKIYESCRWLRFHWPILPASLVLRAAQWIEVLHSNFIRTARAKGLPMRRIIFRHALKPALLPVLSYMGPAFVGIITGSMVIETIYGLPGIGQLFVNGALNRDYSLVLSLTILVGALTILFNAICRCALCRYRPENSLLILELAMMLSKKNSETLENFSEKLEVEGRSLWQDARRRFMHNRAGGGPVLLSCF